VTIFGFIDSLVASNVDECLTSMWKVINAVGYTMHLIAFVFTSTENGLRTLIYLSQLEKHIHIDRTFFLMEPFVPIVHVEHHPSGKTGLVILA
jgi:hypothetical protein